MTDPGPSQDGFLDSVGLAGSNLRLLRDQRLKPALQADGELVVGTGEAYDPFLVNDDVVRRRRDLIERSQRDFIFDSHLRYGRKMREEFFDQLRILSLIDRAKHDYIIEL